MIEFTVPGPPVPKERARFGGGSSKRPRTPKKTRAYESRVGWCAIAAIQKARNQSSKSVWAKGGHMAAVLTFYLPDERTRDVDNLIKSVLDGMNKVVYDDDRQVMGVITVSRVDKHEPRMDARVYRSENREELWRHFQNITAKMDEAVVAHG